MQTLSSGIRWWFENLDSARRRRGAVMDRIGCGPVESACETVLELPGMRLRRYTVGPQLRHGRRSPHTAPNVALIVPAPIKRHYIWDIAPGRSVVLHALQSGMEVYLIEWTDPAPDQPSLGLEDYANRLIEHCMRAIRAAHASPNVFLFSHSLGGIFAAIYAALRPEQVQGLVLVEVPLHFAEASGAFGPIVAFGPPAAALTRMFGCIPGSVLSLSSAMASPATFGMERYVDFFASLDSPAHLRCHLTVERWTLDEAPMSGQLFEQVVQQFYRENRFMRHALQVGGREIGPRDVVAPLLAVYDPRSVVIPPESVIAFHDAAASRSKRLLVYDGDTGVALAHVGALVGENAHRLLWPEVFSWVEKTSALKH